MPDRVEPTTTVRDAQSTIRPGRIPNFRKRLIRRGKNMDLPTFKYHPDPVSTGSVARSDATCRCCGKNRGYIYTSTTYSAVDLANEICPWCIADGSAAKKFEATFNDDYPLLQAGIEDSIILEVTTRTPGFDSWQQGAWLTHCGDACAFLGDASREDLDILLSENLPVAGSEDLEEGMLESIIKNYRPKGSPSFYKFQCLHCNQGLFSMDFD